MDIFQFAMQMEKDGEKYYRKLGLKAEPDEIKYILNWLADEEVKHYQTFKAMSLNEAVALPSVDFLKNVKNIFQQMGESQTEWEPNPSLIKSYQKAQDLEEKSRDFYIEKANEVTVPGQKQLFLQIAEEEKKHYFILENIIEFMRRPERWLENAEWMHIDEY